MDSTLLQQTPLQPDPGIGSGSASERTPWGLKVFGVLLMVGGALLIPQVVGVIVTVVEVFATGAYSDDSVLTIILSLVLAAAVCFAIVAGVVLGVRLVRGRRRRARLIAESMAIALSVAFASDLMLYGVNEGLWLLGVAALILVAAHVVVDPSLSDERELQRRLRLMETREELEEGTLGLDKSGAGFIELDFFNLFWIFVIASVAGVVIESIYHVLVVDFGHYEDRAGLLWGPFSPIYGFGALLMTLALNRFHNAPVAVVFLVSALIGGAFEYFVSWFMEYAFGAVAWDYTGTFLNINGRTNFMFMCMWGVLGVVWVRLALPALLHTVNLIPWRWRYSITAVCAALMIFNGMMTLVALDCWYSRLAGAAPDNALEQFCAEHFDNQWMEHRFESMSIDPGAAHRSS
ncbi:putative ABC transporter permease [uncultured Adlercreutzia sp.]|uniref:putative ABC transporter permease n=1 Tax=uncultured Adlercreutzia sp. TaxID=875803 RepID=UPI00267628AD|nr:putative ABC transporter permease [uncultured Adlercreutzia sp.]